MPSPLPFTGLVALRALTVLAATMGAAPLAPAEPPDAGAEQLRPLVERARNEGWELIAVDPASPTRYVEFARPQDVVPRGAYLAVTLREERSAPATVSRDQGPFSFMSRSAEWVIDCPGNRFTATSQAFYRANALAGERYAETDPTLERWNGIVPNSLGSIVHDWVCARAKAP
jgi:hypothetical protein